MDIFQNLAGIISWAVTIISGIGFFYRGLRKIDKRLEAIEQKLDNHEQRLQTLSDKVDNLTGRVDVLESTVNARLYNLEQARKQDLRVQIKDIYYKYLPTKLIPNSELKTLDYAYDLYHNIYQGNSYIADLNNQMHTWEVVSDNDERVKF